MSSLMPWPRHALPCGMALRLWLVDDTEAHHEVARNTVARLDGVEFESFLTGGEAISAFARLARGGVPPDIVLMDFYLGDDRGDHVTRRLRELEPAGGHCLIVGYSSVADASQRIVSVGGDVIVRKQVAQDGTNPTLKAWLEQVMRTRPPA